MDYFPLGLAAGEAFCNRVQEKQHLSSNIEKVKPTLIISPRRYGKTSLALQAIKATGLPYAHIDFFSELSKADIELSLIKGVGQAIGKVMPAPSKALKLAREFFSELKVKISIEKSGISIDFDSSKRNAKNDLKELLIKFNALLVRYKKKAILFIDEFQRINQVGEDISVEAVLRQIAQQSKNIVFIFSGSNRHLLGQIFDDRNRPFYKLCDRITLERIDEDNYLKYINLAAMNKWHHQLKKPTVVAILQLTEKHPYYLNLLCSRLWRNTKLPTVEEVNKVWNQILIEEKSQIATELDLLSNNQRRLLIGLAKFANTNEPLNKGFAMQVNLSTSSIAQALNVLEQRDYIYRDGNGYYGIIDPLMKGVICGNLR